MKYQSQPILIDVCHTITPGHRVIGVKLSSVNFNYFSSDLQSKWRVAFNYPFQWIQIKEFHWFNSPWQVLSLACSCQSLIQHNILQTAVILTHLWHKYFHFINIFWSIFSLCTMIILFIWEYILACITWCDMRPLQHYIILQCSQG